MGARDAHRWLRTGDIGRQDKTGRLFRRNRSRARDVIAHALIFVGILVAWWEVAGSRGTVITRSVPVEVRGVAAGADFSSPEPAAVTVHLRGPSRLLDGLATGDLHAFVDATEMRGGRSELTVSAVVSPGIDVIRLVPPKVSLDALVRRKLPVAVQLAASFPRTLRVDEVIPAELELVGRSSAFRGVEAVKTRAIEKDAVVDGRVRVQLQLKEGLELADPSRREVVVTFIEPATP